MMKKHRELLEAGEDSYVCWGRGRPAENSRELNFGTKAGFYKDVLQTRMDGKVGFHSKRATRRLLARLDEIDPDVVHLHNIHGYYVNIEMLFNWLSTHRCRVNWTLHDCWAFTGRCPHFVYVGCDAWKSAGGCTCACPQLGFYPKTRSAASVPWNFDRKKRLFNQLPQERLTLITPSHWLENLVKQSFLRRYPVKVVYNTIDTTVFKPTPSDFRERYGIGDRFMILGVASPWTERKGLDDFARLAEELDDSYAIVLVGLSKKQIEQMPARIIGLERTESARELAEIYTAADVLVQPSIEETFGLTVAEAVACGTPVLVRKGSACEEAAAAVGKAKMVSLRSDELSAQADEGVRWKNAHKLVADLKNTLVWGLLDFVFADNHIHDDFALTDRFFALALPKETGR